MTVTQGTETYAYDALGRLLTATPSGGTASQLSYSGMSNTVAADNSNKYSRDPGGGPPADRRGPGGAASGLEAVPGAGRRIESSAGL